MKKGAGSTDGFRKRDCSARLIKRCTKAPREKRTRARLLSLVVFFLGIFFFYFIYLLLTTAH